MRTKEKKIIIITGVFLLLSLISGGASAILINGLAYDILYALHKITSVITAILFIVYIWIRTKEE